MIDWDKAKVIDRESDKSGRHIREAIWIRKTDNMNRDERSYQLSLKSLQNGSSFSKRGGTPEPSDKSNSGCIK